MSRHIVFLEHIPFFSIPYATHDLTRSNLIHIDPFYEDYNSLSSQGLILQIPLLMFYLFFLYIILDVFMLVVLRV